MTTRIGQARPAQIRALQRLFLHGLYNDFHYFPADYLQMVARQNSFLRLLAASFNPRRLLLVVSVGGRIVGYTISAQPRRGQAFIFWVYVHPDWRSHGLGRQLVEQTLRRLQRRGQRRVQLATHDYADYYANFGFHLVPELGFAIGDTTMYIMEKEL